MDPITTAIFAVLPALASDIVKSGVKDAYEGLKAVIRRKWGGDAPISKAIAAIEEDPKSKAQAALLEEMVAAVKAVEDPEVAQALRQLVKQMKTHGIGGEAVSRIAIDISGGTVQGIVRAGNVRIDSLIFGTAHDRDNRIVRNEDYKPPKK
jgi:disulfide oxidoreductase YuzD